MEINEHSGSDSITLDRLQEELLSCKETNRQLVEQSDKKDEEIRLLRISECKVKDELYRANNTIARSKKAKDVFSLEQEVELSRLKLNVQEEEFRLQQSTLISELNKVVQQNEILKSECQKSEMLLKERQNKVEKSENDCAKLEESVDQKQKYEIQNTDLEAENNEYKAKNASLRSTVENLEASVTKSRNEIEELSTKLSYFKQQITELNEKLRKKQESYQMLSEEKERQYIEFKKSLNVMVAKKDVEVSEMANQLHAYRKETEKMREDYELKASSIDSTHSECDRLKRLNMQINEQVEFVQIQLQEALNANDCLSSQLHQAKTDVSEMQANAEATSKLCEERKQLLDDMSKYVEKIKDDYESEKATLISDHELKLMELDGNIDSLKLKLASLENVNEKMQSFEMSLEEKEEKISKLTQKLDKARVKQELVQVQQEEMIDTQQKQFEENLESILRDHHGKIKELEAKLQRLALEKEILNEKVILLEQDVKDKMEQVNASDRKHVHVLKDLKRQLQNEKKRADRLQERMQEFLSDVSHNKSTGSEDVKCLDVSKDRSNGETGSVSSWSFVTGNHKDADRHSNTGDKDSESSVTMLEHESHDLIGRIAQLQRQNFELNEKVHMLEDSSSAMADDLLRKTTLIEQFVKEKPYMVSSHHQHSYASSPSSIENRLPQGLRKMIDFVKVDQNAAEIRDMNKRLQIMLEETLMKNMHLQRDIELMSNETARLSGLDTEK